MSRWPKVRVRDIATFLKGKKPAVTYDSPVSGAQPYILIENFNGAYRLFTDDNRCVACCPEDTLIVADGANSGLVSSGHKGFLGSTIGALRPDTNRIHPRFLFFYTHSLFDVLNKHVRGAAVPHLEKDLLLNLEIVLPPLADQEQIVRILDEADQLRRLRAEADRRTADLIPALFHEMFSSDIDIKLRPSHNLLEEVCTSPAGIKAGPFGSSLKKECYTNDGPRVYGQEQIIAGDFTIGDYHVSQAKYDEMRAYSVYPGDVLISLVGTFGKVAVVPDHAEPGIINPRLIRIRVNKSMISPIFLKHYLELKETQLHLESLARGQTMGVLNATLLKELTVPVPPLDQQNSFAAHVAEIQSFEAEQAASQQRLDALFQSLLHGAFQGEL
jgi:type I restriction enzyme S subunit